MGSLSWWGGMKKPCALMAAILEWSRWPSSRRATPCPDGAWARSGARTGFSWSTSSASEHDAPERGSDPLVERFRAFLAGAPVDFARRRARPRVGDTAPAGDRRRSPQGPARRGRLVRRARRARGTSARAARRGRRVLGESLLVHRPLPPRGFRDGDRWLRRRGSGRQAAAPRPRGSGPLITSEDVRDELATIAPERECDRLAELSALFHSAGSLHLRGAGDWGLHLDLGSGAAARRAFALLRACGIRSEVRTYRRRAFDTATRYQLHVAGDAETLAVLVAAGVVDRRHAPLERPPRRVVARSCCRAAYLRGAFLGAGSLSLGRSPHLELRTASAESAALLARLAKAEGVELATAERRESRRCVRQELGGDRVAPRRNGGGRDGARARGARRGGRDALAREPPRERRPREPRADEPIGAEADRCDRTPRSRRRAGPPARGGGASAPSP